MIFKDKIAVFDLDDTLYVSNSHIELLSDYYNTCFFRSIIFRAMGKIFPDFQLYIMTFLYEKIDESTKQSFLLPFRQDVLKVLKQKISDGYYPLIVSNAPKQLALNAGKKLGIDVLVTRVGEKKDSFLRKYTCNVLFVCTDNKTDLDLLQISNSAIITCKKRHEDFFREKLKNNIIDFLFAEEK